MRGAAFVPVLSTLCALFLLACGGGGGGGGRSLTVTPSPVSFTSLATPVQLVVTESGAGTVLTGSATYLSSDTSVATVSAGGLVTPVNNGAATITVEETGTRASVSVTVSVTPDANSLAIAPTGPILLGSAGAVQQLTVTGALSGVAGKVLTPAARGTTYASSATGVATVSAAGVVTSVAPGISTITATNRGRTAQVEVRSNYDTQIVVTPSSAPLSPGETLQLSVSGNGPQAVAGGLTASGQTTYTTSSATVATVSAGGLITAREPGTAQVTVRHGTLPSRQVAVTVTAGTPALILGRASAAAGGTIGVPLKLSAAAGGPQALAFHVVLSYDPAKLDVTGNFFAASATLSGKTVAARRIGPGQLAIAAYDARVPGSRTTTTSATLGTITFQVAGGAPSGEAAISVTESSLADGNADRLTHRTVPGAVTVP